MEPPESEAANKCDATDVDQQREATKTVAARSSTLFGNDFSTVPRINASAREPKATCGAMPAKCSFRFLNSANALSFGLLCKPAKKTPRVASPMRRNEPSKLLPKAGAAQTAAADAAPSMPRLRAAIRLTPPNSVALRPNCTATPPSDDSPLGLGDHALRDWLAESEHRQDEAPLLHSLPECMATAYPPDGIHYATSFELHALRCNVKFDIELADSNRMRNTHGNKRATGETSADGRTAARKNITW